VGELVQAFGRHLVVHECHHRRGRACVASRYSRGVDDGPVENLRTLLERAFPEASDLAVIDRTGGGDHFLVSVQSGRFRGLSLVDQHRLVYDALAGPLRDGTIHELRIKTKGE
jgi:stress-induced morphogen